MPRKWVCAILLLSLKATTAAFADAVVNIDFELGTNSDTTHVGDDGPLSSPGGTLWTSVVSGVNASNLRDEFGVFTPFDVQFDGSSGADGLGGNNLQDSGTFSGFLILDLVPNATYEIVAYVGENGGFNIRDNSGFIGFMGFGDPGADGWSLPGTEGNGGDYLRVSGLVPFDAGGGVYGLEFLLDGAITGLQIRGAIPEPCSLALLALGAGAIGRRRRARF